MVSRIRGLLAKQKATRSPDASPRAKRLPPMASARSRNSRYEIDSVPCTNAGWSGRNIAAFCKNAKVFMGVSSDGRTFEPGARTTRHRFGRRRSELHARIALVGLPVTVRIRQQTGQQLHSLIELDHTQGIGQIALKAFRRSGAKHGEAVQHPASRRFVPPQRKRLAIGTSMARIHIELAAVVAFLYEQVAARQAGAKIVTYRVAHDCRPLVRRSNSNTCASM